MTAEIIAFAEQRDGKLKKTAREVVTAAHQIAEALGAGVTAVCPSAGAVEDAG